MGSESVSQPPAKIKLMHLVYSFDVGGLERIIANCITSLPDEYEHTIVALTDYSASFVAQLTKPVKMIAMNKPAGQSWVTFKNFYSILKQERPDILHTYNLASLEFQTMAALARVPFRLHAEHGRDISDPDGTNKKYQILRKLVSPFVHKFVPVSDDLYQWLMDTVKLSPSKCQLVRNGVNTDSYRPKTEQQNTNPKSLIFGHVARLSGIKNQTGLMASFALACSQNDSFAATCKLVIVGKGPLQQALEQQLAAIRATQPEVNIEMLGERHDMPAVYQEFSVFVMSSDAEGIPMTMLEAMATGLPVLSTNVGGIPEITSSEQAVLVQAKSVEALAKGMLEIFKLSPDFAGMGEKSRNIVIDNFSQQKMVADYLQLYRKGLIHVRN